MTSCGVGGGISEEGCAGAAVELVVSGPRTGTNPRRSVESSSGFGTVLWLRRSHLSRLPILSRGDLSHPSISGPSAWHGAANSLFTMSEKSEQIHPPILGKREQICSLFSVLCNMLIALVNTMQNSPKKIIVHKV